MFKGKNLYLFNESSNIIWNFASRENSCILCRNFKEGDWSPYEVIAKNCSPKFYLTALPNDIIYVFYKDFNGNLLFKVNNKLKWSKELLLQKNINGAYTIKFKVIPLDDEVNIIYALFNKATNKTILLHQKLHEIYKLSDIKLIDTIDGYNNTPINIYITKDKELRILYQRFNDFYELGYKTFNLTTDSWSSFNLVARDDKPFINYNFLLLSNNRNVDVDDSSSNSNLHEKIYSYTKLINQKDKLIYNLNASLDIEKKNSLSCRLKLEKIEESLKRFTENKELIQECIDYLKENLTIKNEENLKLKEISLQDNIKIQNLTKEVLSLRETLNNQDSRLSELLADLVTRI